MGRLKFLNEREVRRRARRLLMTEAYHGLLSVSDQTTTKSLTSSELKYRGSKDDKGQRLNETADSAMHRLMHDIDRAKPGDTFYLTYALSEFTTLGRSQAEIVDPSGGPVVQYTAQTLTNFLRGLTGEYVGSEADFFSTDAKKSDRERDLRASKSALSTGQDMIESGMQAIMDVQVNRVRQLREVLADIEGDNPMTPPQAVEQLYRIISPQSVGATGRVNPAELAKAVTNKLLRGEIRLSNEADERAVINGAITMALGEYVFRTAKNTTGVVGEGTRIDMGGKVEVVNPISPALAKNMRDKIMNFSDPVVGRDIRERAIDFLTASCASNCNFGVGDLTQTPGRMHGRLDKSGLPASVIMQTINLLLFVMMYGEVFTGGMKDGKRVPGKWSERHLPDSQLGSLFWGFHIDPEASIRVANALNKSVSGSAAEIMGQLSPGSRERRHYSPEVNAVIVASRELSDDKGNADPGAVRTRASEILGREITPLELTSLRKAADVAINAKRRGAGLSDDSNRRGYEMKLHGTHDALHADPAAVLSSAVDIVRNNEAGQVLSKAFLSRMLYGVTLRCVGRRKGTVVTKDAIKTALSAGTEMGAREATSHEVPIFDAYVEQPKQRRSGSIEDVDQLAKMQTMSSGPDLPHVSHAGALEGSAKVSSPDELLAARRRRRTHQAIVATTNFSFSLASLREALSGQADIGDALSKAENYTVMGAIKQHYIEKVPSTRRNVTPDFVLQLESLLTENLNPKKETIQLIGAQKFTDPAHAMDRVPFEKLRPIPELGIADTGIGSRLLQGAPVAPGEVGLKHAASYNVVDRILRDPNDHPLRVSVKKTLEQIQRELETQSDLGRVNHMERVANELRSDMSSSHGRTPDRFETMVNSRLVSRSIRGLLAELHTIAHSDDASITPNFTVMENLALDSLSAAGIRSRYDAASGGVRPLTTEERAMLEGIVDTIRMRFAAEIGERSETRMTVVPISSVVLAALSGESPAKSGSDIAAHIAFVSPTFQQAVEKRGGSDTPLVQPILPRIIASREAAVEAEKQLSGLDLASIARTIDGAFGEAPLVHQDLRAGEDTVPLEVIHAIVGARTNYATIQSPSYGSTVTAISETIKEDLEGLQSFAKRLNQSSYGENAAKAGRRAVETINDKSDVGGKTVLGTFLAMATGFASHAQSNRTVLSTELERLPFVSNPVETVALLNDFLTSVMQPFVSVGDTPIAHIGEAAEDLLDAISSSTSLLDTLQEVVKETGRLAPSVSKPPEGKGASWRDYYDAHQRQLLKNEEALGELAAIASKIRTLSSYTPSADLSERIISNIRRAIDYTSLEIVPVRDTTVQILDRLLGEDGVAAQIILDISNTFSEGQRSQVLTNLSISVGAMATDPKTFAAEYTGQVGVHGRQLKIAAAILGDTEEFSYDFVDPYEVARRIINSDPADPLARVLIMSMFPTTTSTAATQAGGIARSEPGRRDALRQRITDLIRAYRLVKQSLNSLLNPKGPKQGEILDAIMAIGEYLKIKPSEEALRGASRVDPRTKSIYGLRSGRPDETEPQVVIRRTGERVKADRTAAASVAADTSPRLAPPEMETLVRAAEKLREIVKDNPDVTLNGAKLSDTTLGDAAQAVMDETAKDQVDPRVWTQMVAIIPHLLEGLATLIAYEGTLRSGNMGAWDAMSARGKGLAPKYYLEDVPDEVGSLVGRIRRIPTPEGWQV